MTTTPTVAPSTTAIAPGRAALDALGASFWTWRGVQQPRTADDIPRIERPTGWLPAWSPADVVRHRAELAGFAAQWAALPVPARGGDRTARALLVDHALLGSAIARARFELGEGALWSTAPAFYLDQSIGVYYDELLALPGFDEARAERIARALEHVPTVLAWGRRNLATSLVREFAQTALAALEDVEARLAASLAALVPLLPASHRDRVAAAGAVAGDELVSWRAWVAEREPRARRWSPLGEAGLARFLREVALIPLTSDQMLDIASRELARAEALTALEEQAVAVSVPGDPRAPLAATVDEQVQRERDDELAIRRFYVERGILHQPDTLGHYLVAPLPDYLAPLTFLGVSDDLTGPSRVDEDGVSYMPAPREGLPYFYDANARDPRAGIIHEGAHYQQLALSWRHENALRRHYYDSGSNEGIAFYNEELMLRSGLFADAPGTRLAVHSFLRLRALRVLVDLGLATGRLGVIEAGALMAERVPMDVTTATDEAALYLATPTLASSYQIGKAQIVAFLADARRVQGADFSLIDFHDALWLNGNVPVALQRYELLGLDDELDRIRL